MALSITTDVFCDGDDCSQWTPGVSGALRAKPKEARAEAKRNGWGRFSHRDGDFCPACIARMTGRDRRTA